MPQIDKIDVREALFRRIIEQIFKIENSIKINFYYLNWKQTKEK